MQRSMTPLRSTWPVRFTSSARWRRRWSSADTAGSSISRPRWGSFAEGMGGPGMYGVTKAALNALTVRLANELPSAVKVNAMCPGWVRTRMGGQGATRSPDEAADTAVWLATLPDDGPTGGFFRDRKPIEW